MRGALFATAAMNLGGALAFTPYGGAVRALAGLPDGAPPVYLATIGVFILTFGVAYLWTAVSGRADPLFIAVAASGKLAFFVVLTWYWARGQLPGRAPLAGSGDLLFGLLFLAWLVQVRAGVRARTRPDPVRPRATARGGR